MGTGGQPSSPTARLRWVSSSGERRSLEISGPLVIGRDAVCTLVVADTQASRKHAEVSFREGCYRLRDLGSRHGTFLNTERVEERALASGDQIQIGSTVLVFEDEGEVSEVIHDVALPVADADARLQIFYDLADGMLELSDADGVLGRLLESVRRVLGAERAAAGLCGLGGLRIVARAGPSSSPDVQIARDVQAAALSGKRALVVQEPDRSETLMRQQVRSAMAAPLLAGELVLGLLYVDDRGSVGRFDAQDLRFLAALGRLAGSVIDGAERLRDAMAAVEASRADDPLAELAGESAVMGALRVTVRKVAASDASVVIVGESGTGKELVARALHGLSPRADKPFVAINCAALPDSMVEAELFGHTRGAFTGAAQDRRGRFALAHRGTLFLDEVAELSLDAQAKVLRALQEREVLPIGAERPVRIDLRVIAASHRDLWAEVKAGRFREDLYYRLLVVEVCVPPLRARGADVKLLAGRFLTRAARRQGRPLVGFSQEAVEVLSEYSWPGNVRELQNEVERAVIFAEGPLVGAWDLSARLRGAPASRRSVRPAAAPDASAPAGSIADRFAALEPAERALVQEALGAAKGNLSKAARLLGITRIMAQRRVERFGLKVEREEGSP